MKKGHNYGFCKICKEIHQLQHPMQGKKRPNQSKFMKENNPMLGKHHSEETKMKISISRTGKKYPKLGEIRKKLFKEGKLRNPFKGKHHTEETKRKISKSNYHINLSSKNNPFYGRHHTEEIKEKMKKPKSEEHKRRISETRKRLFKEGKIKNLMKDINYLKKIKLIQHIRPNKPEKIIIDLIKKNNLPFNYVGDGRIWFRGETTIFNPDFLSKNPKYIMEVFGDYWHNIPKNKKRDEERLKTYSKYGYKTLIIWENELKNPNQVVNKIREFI